MADEPTPGSVTINAKVSNVTGTTAIGTNIDQDVTEITFGGLPPDEQAELAKVFAAFRAEVEREVSPELKREAVHQAREIEKAAAAPTPDVGAIATARRWLLDHAPTLFGTITAVLANPILGKVVQAAGDSVAEEFKRRFPDSFPADE